jgi:FMN-dependent NADH-azoreductase
MCVRTQIASPFFRQEFAMTTLLHVSASPRGDTSESLALARLFLQTFSDVHPDVRVTEWNVWDGSIPEFGPAAAAGKMSVFAGTEPAGESATAWAAARATFDRFAAADAYLFSVPMWNAGIPYKLKQLIDVISQPGMVFGFDPIEGYSGLVRGRKAAVLYTSAVYGEGRGPAFGSDFQAPYLRDWLTWMGITEISEVFFRPNLATPDAAALREVARADTRQLAKSF